MFLCGWAFPLPSSPIPFTPISLHIRGEQIGLFHPRKYIGREGNPCHPLPLLLPPYIQKKKTRKKTRKKNTKKQKKRDVCGIVERILGCLRYYNQVFRKNNKKKTTKKPNKNMYTNKTGGGVFFFVVFF